MNRKTEVLCFVGVAKFCFREWGSFVLNRNWRPGGVRPQGGWLGAPTGERWNGRGLGSKFSQIHHPLAACKMQNVVCVHRLSSAKGTALRPGAVTGTARPKAKGTHVRLAATNSKPWAAFVYPRTVSPQGWPAQQRFQFSENATS